MTHSDEAPEELQLHFMGQRLDPHRLVYGTIILMTTIALYEGATDDDFGTKPFLYFAGILLAPLVALTMAHAFSEGLDMHIRLKRNLTAREGTHLLKENLQYLYLAVPPLLLVLVLRLFGVNPTTIIAVVQGLGILSLFGWGFYAGRKAELTGVRTLLMGVAYMLSGVLVIALELLLTH